MVVSSKHTFRKRCASLLLLSAWQRQAKDLLQSFHRNQQKSQAHCTLARLLFSAQEHSSFLGAQVTMGTRRLARSHCRNRDLGMEMIPSNQAVPVEHVWAERTGCRSEQEPCAFFIAKEQVGCCSQLCLLLLLPKTASTISKCHNGTAARTRGRGMAQLDKSRNKETILFFACWNNLRGWRELFSIWLDCKWTVLQRGKKDSTHNNLWNLWNTLFRNNGLSF